jgi:hypothetical protein
MRLSCLFLLLQAPTVLALLACSPGYYPKNDYCEMCPYNSYSDYGATQVSDCLCAPGYYAQYTSTVDMTCETCSANTYKEEFGDGPCVSCPTYASSPEQSWSITQCKCNAGYTGNNGETCESCAAGKFKYETGPYTCENCPVNSISPQASTDFFACLCNAGYTGPQYFYGNCEACATGTYKSSVGTVACTTCPANTISSEASTSIEDCQCAVGYVEDSTGCVCDSGYTTSDGLQCAPCAMGTYKPNTGTQTCTACPENSYIAHVGSTSAGACLCNMGYTGPDGGPCIACASGTFKKQTGSGPCTACASSMDLAGKYVTRSRLVSEFDADTFKTLLCTLLSSRISMPCCTTQLEVHQEMTY